MTLEEEVIQLRELDEANQQLIESKNEQYEQLTKISFSQFEIIATLLTSYADLTTRFSNELSPLLLGLDKKIEDIDFATDVLLKYKSLQKEMLDLSLNMEQFAESIVAFQRILNPDKCKEYFNE
jgi:hypothetical protein